jgi:hypothetical protein
VEGLFLTLYTQIAVFKARSRICGRGTIRSGETYKSETDKHETGKSETDKSETGENETDKGETGQWIWGPRSGATGAGPGPHKLRTQRQKSTTEINARTQRQRSMPEISVKYQRQN